jgi:hypothetical protein
MDLPRQPIDLSASSTADWMLRPFFCRCIPLKAVPS